MLSLSFVSKFDLHKQTRERCMIGSTSYIAGYMALYITELYTAQAIQYI